MIQTFWLVLTYGCNNNCNFCYADCQIQEPVVHKPMPLVYAYDIISTMADNNISDCLLIGGEPTIHPQLDKIIKYCNERGVKTTLITNGRKLKDRHYLDKLITNGLNHVTLSIEGSTANLHNFITKRNSYNDSVAGIKNCLDANLKLGTLTTITKSNYEDCVAVMESLSVLGVKNIGFNCAIPSVSKTGVSANETVNPQQLADKITEIYLASKKYLVQMNFNLTIPLCLFDEKILQTMLNEKVCGIGCQMYYGKGIAFDPIGNILPCTHFADFPILTKNINNNGSFKYKEQLLQFWREKGSVPQQFREALWQYPVERCKSCQFWGRCIGGCPLLWSYFKTQEYLLTNIHQGGEKNG